MRSRLSSQLLLLIAMLLPVVSATRAFAQCALQWQPGHPVAGTNGGVRALLTWDPDGSGPRQPVLVVGGRFTVAGSVQTQRIATYDPLTGAWSVLGSGMNGDIYALASMPNGDLVAGGVFSTAGGVAASRVARWNGTSWSALGSGVTGPVTSLATLPSGDLVVGGAFTTAGGVSANRIARWNGSSWSALGPGFNGNIDALVTMPNGDLVAGGSITLAGSVSVSYIARWNGSAWTNLGPGVTFPVQSLSVRPNGDLIAGGWNNSGNQTSMGALASWNGTSWSALGAGITFNEVRATVTMANGDLVATGFLPQAGGVPVDCVARWDGLNWSAFGNWAGGPATKYGFALATLPSGELVVGGEQMTTLSGRPVTNIAKWTGADWIPLEPGTNASVKAVAALPDGRLVAGGNFRMIGGVAANRVAIWNGAFWAPLGSGIDGVPPSYNETSVNALHARPNGDLIAGGVFTSAGGVAATGAARWNGSAWSPLGTGPGGPVRTLAEHPNGELLAAGSFGQLSVGRWNGVGWYNTGAGLGQAWAVAALPNGTLVAGGNMFDSSDPILARFVRRESGFSWVNMGSGFNSYVYALTVLRNGDLVACGDFTLADGTLCPGVARWNGTNWRPLGTSVAGAVYSATVMPNGDLVVAGSFSQAGGVPARNLARWDGTSWSAFGSGLNDVALAVAALPNGELAVGGQFTIAGGNVSAYVARLATPCPALTTVVGAGCNGSAGPVQLTAANLPWLGSSFVVRGSGFAANAIGISVLGVSQVNLPLSSLHPAGLPGCDVRTLGDLGTSFLLPTNGAATASIAVPTDAALVGLTARVQMASIEPGLQSPIGAIASTNAIEFVLGRF